MNVRQLRGAFLFLKQGQDHRIGAIRQGAKGYGGTMVAVPGPSPATVASANRFSRVAEGFSTT